MRTGPFVGLVALVLCGPLACGGGGGGGGSSTPTSPATPSTPPTPSTPTPATPSAPASPTTVAVENNTFTPSTLTVAPGSTVTWTWDTCTAGYDPYGASASTCVDHSIVWDAGGVAASPTQSQGSYQRTFATAGTYSYHCAVHGVAMAGKVVVQ